MSNYATITCTHPDHLAALRDVLLEAENEGEINFGYSLRFHDENVDDAITHRNDLREEVSNLYTRTDELNELIDQLKSEKQESQEKIDELSVELEELTMEHEILKDAKEEYMEQLETCREERGSLELQLDNLSDAQEQISNLKVQVNTLKVQCDDFEASYEQRGEVIEEQRKKLAMVADIRAEVDNLKDKALANAKELDQMRIINRNLEMRSAENKARGNALLEVITDSVRAAVQEAM